VGIYLVLPRVDLAGQIAGLAARNPGGNDSSGDAAGTAEG